jgi:hypothetical protein
MSLAPFAKSAHRAARWLTALVSYAEKTAPDIGLNLEAVVQESRKCGCALPELEGYWKEKALPPALVLIGSDHRLAERLARLLSLPLTFPELPTRTVIWELRGGSQDSFALHYGDSERHISQSALTSFLEKGVAAENIVRVCQTVRTEVPCKWRLVWIPSPQTFGDLWESATGIRILTRQHGAVLILEEVPAELLAAVRDLGQRRWEIRQGDIGNAEGMARLEAEIGALIETIPAQQTAREAASWQWLRERCRIILERRRGELQKVLAQQHGQMKRIDQFLSQYRHSWLHGFRNQVETHLQRQAKTADMGKLVKAKELSSSTFLQAISLGTLRSRLESFVLDRLAEFIEGLGALAGKLDIPKVSLPENHVSWTAGDIAAKLESAFQEREILVKKKGHGPLIKRITGQSHRREEEQRRELEHALSLTSDITVTSWSEWSSQFLTDLRREVEKSIEGSLMAAGRPTSAQLKEKIAAIQSIVSMLYGEAAPKSARAQTRAKRWLETLARSQLFPTVQSES